MVQRETQLLMYARPPEGGTPNLVAESRIRTSTWLKLVWKSGLW
jgi:hypothetical protein